MESMTLALSDLDKTICILSNASDSLYVSLVTQKHVGQPDLLMERQDHQPLAFVVRRVQRRRTMMDSTREGMFRFCRHSY
jgi:predicted amino acid racemase